MPFFPTAIPDLLLFEPKVFADERGHFFESFNRQVFAEQGIHPDFVQDNQAYSQYGVVRGLHYQIPPFGQAKLVRVLEGEVLDIALDIRPDSPTYGQWYGVTLSAENRRQLYIPRGFAHGYSVLSPTATFFYKCDNFYSRKHEGGISYDDPGLQIDWGLPPEDIVLSEKDRQLPAFGQHRAYREER
ncbi:MAG: dTDP-4-dehydrorhamnose 3,5-epimerase [Saprospiraceae bacterium]|nr:dTDP-4-dehydrorhamnose 3,5-epimerase [Saprospiraceae bacterium]MCB0625747.1 dTDP-4-dehydrorhamnose 3,5-epimerase [Saprospiraceae bacterium]MCB0677943.1 dTDP-4-dehydrorhamnose 3,5-epimerase [Saprospiraceae bacterium]MCB0679559.1 dTDP-4-dehydrorhamnose 3,5-epimerase [Saprospiraceae bacterium]